ncbi:hypothetical protein BVG16_13380 [Paenibacillus selenitireducens]|uniref:Helix-turn-helix domain-containing protein n=1 Tax=Paenibacillus selenitireducens TaxID=1324314 RepID=A0A1T2XC96_9BACL|nr:helix-turn-helix domain-containing protein [Paenibacillus selenitireducens]OPA77445.1 hypothetical protein BVG16_13380 [Paenibacillus selenitireducens]
MTVTKNSNDFISEIKEVLLNELREAINQEIPKILDQRRMTVAQAAKYIDVSEDILYLMCKEGVIPHYRAGSERSTRQIIRFRVSALDKWMEEQELKCMKGATA